MQVESELVGRVSIFAKGNVDIHDSLHSCRIGGELRWNGINESLRDCFPETRVRLRHETLTRFDALLAATGEVPAVLEQITAPLGNYPLAGQFSDKIYSTAGDAVVLSILPDVVTTLHKHKTEGFMFYPAEASSWPNEERAWLSANFDHVGLCDVEASMDNLAAVAERIRQQHDVPILVYNMSPVVPGDTVHCHLGLEENYSTRIRRFNLALIELSREIGISIVDLDTIVAREGADRMKVDTMHLTPAGYELASREVVRILADLGVFEREGAFA